MEPLPLSPSLPLPVQPLSLPLPLSQTPTCIWVPDPDAAIVVSCSKDEVFGEIKPGPVFPLDGHQVLLWCPCAKGQACYRETSINANLLCEELVALSILTIIRLSVMQEFWF